MRFPNYRTETNLEVTSARQAARQGDAVNTFNQLAKRPHGLPRPGAWGSFQKPKCAEERPFLGPVGKRNRHRQRLWWNGILMLHVGIFSKTKSRICRSGWFRIAILVSNIWFWHVCKRYTYIPAILFTSQFSFMEPARSFFACHRGIADWFVERVILCKEWSSRAWYLYR